MWKEIELKLIEPNDGQIEGLAKNPRQWTKDDFEKLRKSIEETPELMQARGLLTVEHRGKYVVLGGNMRLAVLKRMKARSVQAYVFPENTPVEKLKEIVIKDNGSFGQWDFDSLADEWGDVDLSGWGVDIPDWTGKTETDRLSGLKFKSAYFEPEDKPELKLEDCIDMEKFNSKVKAIEDSGLGKERKELMKKFAYRFIKIDFERVAEYYAFNASDEEKKVMERLRLVLVDGGVEGFIEDGLIRVNGLLDCNEER